MATSSSSPLLLLCLLLACAAIPLPRAMAQSSSSCAAQTFSQNRAYPLCSSLPELGSTLHWTLHPENGTVDLAYWIPQDTTWWAAWAINPSGLQMNGSNALMAFHNQTTGSLELITVVVAFAGASFNPTIQNESLSFKVYSQEVEYTGGAYIIYATIDLPGNSTAQNTVWQAGNTYGSDGFPYGHPTTGQHLQSFTSLNFVTGGVSTSSDVRQQRKNIHGIINTISWGILMPLGVMMARYMKVFADPAWFYLHIGFQCTGYLLGISGWAIGLSLGSTGPTYQPHKNIGIALFCLATLQVFALFLRPGKDSKYRFYWNMYHHSVGYSVIILSIVNIFEGFSVLQPAEGWKTAYITIISLIGGVALALEVITWVIVLRRRSEEESGKPHMGGAAASSNNNRNGYGAHQVHMQQRV